MGVRRCLVATALVLAACATGGCHTMRFQISHGEEAGPPITETRTRGWWGLGTRRTVNVRTRCPHGATAIVERSSGGDVMMAIFTFGARIQHTVTFHCRAGGGA